MSRRAQRDERDLQEAMEWVQRVEATKVEWPEPRFDASEVATEVISARFQPSLYAAMRIAAALTGVKLSQWVREACIHRLVAEDQHRAAVAAACEQDRERQAPVPGGDATP